MGAVIIIQRYMYQGPWLLALGVGPAHRYLVVLYICHAICSDIMGGPRPHVFSRVRQYVALTYLKQLISDNGKSKNLIV